MVIAYLRVSTSKQNISNQREEIERFAASNGMHVDQWIKEVVSGKKSRKLRKLGHVLRKMKQGDVMIVSEVSRLSRNLTEIMTIVGDCLEKGICVYSIKENYKFDDSINSKVLCFAFGLVAEIERNLISQRTKEALALRKAEGVKLGRREGDSPKMKLLERNIEEIDKMKRICLPNSKIAAKMGVSTETLRVFLLKHPEIAEKRVLDRIEASESSNFSRNDIKI